MGSVLVVDVIDDMFSFGAEIRRQSAESRGLVGDEF